MMLSITYHITPVSQEQFDTKVGLGTITPSVLPPAMLPLPRGSFLPLLDNFFAQNRNQTPRFKTKHSTTEL